VRIGAAGVILDVDGRVLLVKQTYGLLNWELPGGAAEAHESPDDTVLREVREETGLAVTALHLTGYYYDPEADFLHFVFRCGVCDGDSVPRADLTEVSECRYWPRCALPRPISDFTVRRIEDAVVGIKFGLPTSGRAAFVVGIVTRMVRSIVSGSAWEPTPWWAVQRAAWEVLGRTHEAGDPWKRVD
jgi:8-oxo-dGTP pyrophosphatase MutT (NUDIX family)